MTQNNTPIPTQNNTRTKDDGERCTIKVTLPRVLADTLDLKAQYDRCSRSDAVRELLWKAVRMTAATDKRFAELLTRNGIDVAPVNLRPRRGDNKDDPSDLV